MLNFINLIAAMFVLCVIWDAVILYFERKPITLTNLWKLEMETVASLQSYARRVHEGLHTATSSLFNLLLK